MAHPGVHGLRTACGRAVAQAVGVRAQVRAALDDLATDPELRLARVEAGLEVAAARVLRGAARDCRRRRGAGWSTSRRSTPRRCRPCRTARTRSPGSSPPARCGSSRSHGCAPGEVRAVPGVRHDPAAATRLVAPGERGALETAAGGVLPLGLGGQPTTRPGGVRLRVLVGDVHDRVVRAPLDRAAGSLGPVPAGTRRPGPPLAEVPQVDRPVGPGEDHRAGLEVLRRRSRVVGRVERPLGHRGPAGGLHERREPGVGHGHRLDRERPDADPVDRRLLGVVRVGTHGEHAAGEETRGRGPAWGLPPLSAARRCRS